MKRIQKAALNLPPPPSPPPQKVKKVVSTENRVRTVDEDVHVIGGIHSFTPLLAKHLAELQGNNWVIDHSNRDGNAFRRRVIVQNNVVTIDLNDILSSGRRLTAKALFQKDGRVVDSDSLNHFVLEHVSKAEGTVFWRHAQQPEQFRVWRWVENLPPLSRRFVEVVFIPA
jgi:hypothetical protein